MRNQRKADIISCFGDILPVREEYYLTFSPPYRVEFLTFLAKEEEEEGGGSDNRRRNSLYLTREKEGETRRYDILPADFYHLLRFQHQFIPPLFPAQQPLLLRVFGARLLRNVSEWLICKFWRLEQPQRRVGRWRDNGAGVFSPIRFRDGDSPPLD